MNWLIVLLLILPAALTQSLDSQQAKESSVKLVIPKAPWTVVLSGEALALNRQEIKPDGGSGYFMMVDRGTRMIASVYIEPVDRCRTSKDCRDLVWKTGNPVWQKPQNVKLGEMGEISTLELLVPEYQGEPVRQQNLYAEFVRDGYWVDVHLSKVGYQDQDHVLFETMVHAVRFEPKTVDSAEVRHSAPAADERTAKETMQLVVQASVAYFKNDYKNAIQLYGKVLDREKTQPTLDKNIWRVVVDNLGMSYGLSGDNKKAKEVFAYGVSNDPTYPMFYYNLACASAELNDLDGAIENLRLAVRNRANVLAGEQVPDPATDSSFARFLNDPRFQKVLREIGPK